MSVMLSDGRRYLQCIRCARAFPPNAGAFLRRAPLRDPMCAACLDLRGGYIAEDEWRDRVTREGRPTESPLVWGDG